VAECDLATITLKGLGASSVGVPEEKREVPTDDMLKKDIYIRRAQVKVGLRLERRYSQR